MNTDIDLSGELWGDVFEPLKDINEFKKVSLQHGTIHWPNDADFAPEYLYSLAQKNVIQKF